MKKILKDYMFLSGAVAVFALGCSQEPGGSSKGATVEVRGEKIEMLAEARPAEVGGAVDADAPDSLPVADAAAVEVEEPAEPVTDSLPAVVEGALTAAIETASGGPSEVIQSNGQDYLSVGFDYLASYEFEVTDDLLEAKEDAESVTEKTNGMIPENVRKLDASSVAVKGYMLPLKVEEGQVTEFLLMRDQSMCCFGTVPKINEWVSVKTIGSGVKPIMDEPVTIFGKLHVGEIRENGYLVGIYRMDGEKLAGPLDL